MWFFPLGYHRIVVHTQRGFIDLNIFVETRKMVNYARTW